MIIIQPTIQPSPALEGIEQHAPEHMRAIFVAVRDDDVAYLQVIQGEGKFRASGDRPVIGLLGDDLFASFGPTAFHRPSVRKFLKTCASIVVVACEAIPRAYEAAVEVAAGRRRNVCIIETLPAHEHEWLTFIAKFAPAAAVLHCRVWPKGSRTIH